jgi:hypothetical protein
MSPALRSGRTALLPSSDDVAGGFDPCVVEPHERAVRLVLVHRDADEKVAFLFQRKPQKILWVLRFAEELRCADEDGAVERVVGRVRLVLTG